MRFLMFKKFASRPLLTAAFFCPTLDACLNLPLVNAERGIIWGLVVAILTSNFLPVGATLFLGFLLIPVIFGMFGFIALDGYLPPVPTLVETLCQTHFSEISSATYFVSHKPQFILWAIAYLTLLLAAAILTRANAAHEAKIKNIITLSSILLLSFNVMAQTLFVGTAPAWLMRLSDVQQTALGTTGLITIDWVLTELTVSSRGNRSEAHESVQITKPMLSVLVIGESMRADAIGSNTATRGPWSNALNERVKAGLGAWLPPVCAIHDSTAISVPALITGTSAENLLNWVGTTTSLFLRSEARDDIAILRANSNTAPTGLSRLQSAGYDVGWIASIAQELHAGPEVLNNKGFLWISPVHSRYTTRGAYDEELLPAVTDFVAPTMAAPYQGKPKALVVHLFGSHFDYQDRYPDTLFVPEPEGLSDEKLQDLRYDRANEYGAKILASISDDIDKAEIPAFLVYTSDHGENLIRDHNGILGHVAARTSLAGVMVPFFVTWNRAAEVTGLPEKVLSEVQKAQQLAQIDVYHVWMSLSGLDGGSVVHPTKNPMVFGAVDAGDPFRPLPCSALHP